MNWPLNINNFNFWDKIRIASFILDGKNKWTQNTKVIEFEKLMAEYVGSKYAVFVSSGSTANSLMAQYVKDSSKDFIKKKPSHLSVYNLANILFSLDKGRV